MTTRPFILEPLRLRSGIRYRNLKHYFFSTEEKEWICRDLISNNDVLKSTLSWDCTHFIYYQDNYFISKEVFYDWVDMFINGEPLIAGRPNFTCPIDNVGLQIIEDVIVSNRDIEMSLDFDNILSITLDEQLYGTIERRNFYNATH